MYTILTSNVKLVIYLKKINATFFEEVQQINGKRYGKGSLAMTTDKNIAMIALVEGSKVYETSRMVGLIPICYSKNELIDAIIDEFFEALSIRKTSKGYEYLKYMLKCNINDDCYCLKSMTTEVYPECAKHFNVSASTIAKYSNLIIRNSYNRNSLKYDVLYFTNRPTPLKEAPKVNNFVVVMANKIRSLLPNT